MDAREAPTQGEVTALSVPFRRAGQERPAPRDPWSRMARRVALWLASRPRTRFSFRLLGLVVAIICVYAFFGSLGRPWHKWPTFTVDYDLLSQSFREGHLYVPITPNPELVRQADPYDPVHVDLWVLDESYYKGKYYLYWGPVPALIQALVKSALGIQRVIGDQYITFAAWSLGSAATAMLLHRLAQRLFGRISRVVIAACILAFAFANPILHLISDACVYQGAISTGQGFLLLGLFFACDAVFHAHRRPRQRLRWLAAGLSFGLAVGARLSLAPATALLILSTALFSGPLAALAAPEQSKPPRERWFTAVTCAFWMGLPLAACVGALLLYNKARFDNYFETGISLQLSPLKYRFSTAYFPANLYSYFLQRFELDSRFPYVHQLWNLNQSALPKWLPFPEGYFAVEPLVGILRAAPIVWCAPIALLVMFGFGLRGLWRRRSARSLLFVHAASSFIVISSVTAVPVFGLYVPSMRYLGDFSSGLVLLGVLGALTLYARTRRRSSARRVAGVAICTLSLLTVTCGMLLGYQGYVNTFKQRNPALAETLERTLSF